MIDLVAFGIILDDIVFPEGYTRMGVLGGGGPQTAWGMAAALGHGEPVGLVAGVGTDLDESALSPLRAARINLDGLRITDLPTPRAWQVTESDGRRAQVWRVPVHTLGPQLARRWDVLPPAYQSARAFHWGIHPGETPLTFAESLRAEGKLVSLEPFKAPDRVMSEDELRNMIAACDVFSPNLFEAARLVQQADEIAIAARFRDLGCRVLALRRGDQGADVWDLPEGRGVRVPAVPAQVVDSVGAGNTFCGALLARLGEGIDAAACHAVVAASYLVEQVGLPPALPDPADYTRRLAGVRTGLQELTM